jgi:uncharacterized protein (TIGR02996 family)
MLDDPAFIRMIAAAPDDDAPRLVYADYLEETGDPAKATRAEFIRVQVERARLVPDTPRWTELWHRETALLGWAKRWRQELPAIEGVQYGGFVRGFIDQIQASTTALYRNFQVILDLIPLRALTLSQLDARTFRKLAQSTEFTQIEELQFDSSSRLSSALAKALVKRGPWPRLRRLRLPERTTSGSNVLLSSPPYELIKLSEAFGSRLQF